jgi:hypothetical protein
MPLPTSSFLTAAQIFANEQGSSNISIGTIRQGDLAQQLEAMKHARAHDLEERRSTILEARYVMVMKASGSPCAW